MTKLTQRPEKSSFIAEIAWEGADGKPGILTVTMTKGPEYRYADVPREVYDDFARAESWGRFFGASVKGRYEQIEEDA